MAEDRWSVDRSLEKISTCQWETSLGKALVDGVKIANAYEKFEPGASILRGAIAFGALLLNPESSLENLEKERDNLKFKLEKITLSDQKPKLKELLGNKLKTKIDKLDEKIADPPNEISSDYEKINSQLEEIISGVVDDYKQFEKKKFPLSDVVIKTYNFVSDQGYKVSINW